MRRKFLVSIIVIIASIALSIFIRQALAYTTLRDSAGHLTEQYISGEASIPLTPQALIDNFNTASVKNKWNDVTGSFSSDPALPANARCVATFTNKFDVVYGGTGYSLQLNYNVNKEYSYAGYYTKLGGAGISGYKALSFMVRGSVPGQLFKIELKNSSTAQGWSDKEKTHYYRNSASVYVTDYLAGGVTNGWQKVTIPLDAFANLDGLSSMKELVFVFENSQSTVNGSPLSGTVYIDEIRLETAAPNFVYIGSFNNRLGRCALGGNIGNAQYELPKIPGAKYSFSGDQYVSAPFSMLSQYDTRLAPGWTCHFMIFGGGNVDSNLAPVEDETKMGWIPTPHDFSAYNYISLDVMARSSTENPVILRFEIVDGKGTKYWRKTGIASGSWTPWKMAIGAAVEKTTIMQFNIVYENDQIRAYNGSANGAIYIDNLRFEK